MATAKLIANWDSISALMSATVNARQGKRGKVTEWNAFNAWRTEDQSYPFIPENIHRLKALATNG